MSLQYRKIVLEVELTSNLSGKKTGATDPETESIEVASAQLITEIKDFRSEVEAELKRKPNKKALVITIAIGYMALIFVLMWAI